MSKWLKRLKCLHYYTEEDLIAYWPDPILLYRCVDCDKTVQRRPSSPPVSGPRETYQEHYERMVATGNACLVMRPPLGMENEVKL